VFFVGWPDSNPSTYKANIPSKPMTALIQGREDDEPIVPQNISSIIKVKKCSHLIIVAGNHLRNSSSLRLGEFSFDMRYGKDDE
jgi:hypothetical protein